MTSMVRFSTLTPITKFKMLGGDRTMDHVSHL